MQAILGVILYGKKDAKKELAPEEQEKAQKDNLSIRSEYLKKR